MRLSRRSEPFDSEDFIYELKIDGFRALAHIQDGRGELVSRNGNTFRGFPERADWLAAHIKVKSAVLDGEIACVDGAGRPMFRDLLFRKRKCIFVAFDLLFLNGRDLRPMPLLERKAQEADPEEALTAVIPRSRRRRRRSLVRADRQDGPGRHRLQAEGFAV